MAGNKKSKSQPYCLSNSPSDGSSITPLTLESAIRKNKIEVAGNGFAGKWWCVK